MIEHIQSKSLIVRDHKIQSYEALSSHKELPPLLFLHGWRSEAHAWFPLFEHFKEEGRTMYFLDLPGFGLSENPHQPFTIDNYTDIVLSFIQRMNLLNPVIVGHSFGGRVAIKLAAKYPHAVSKLVLTGSAGVLLEGKKNAFKKTIARIVKPLFKPSFMKPLRKKIYTYMGAEDYLATPLLKETFLQVINEDLEPLLGDIQCEVLLVWGKEDEATPLQAGYIMNQKIKKSKIVILENAGHYAFLDKPKEFSESVIEFLKSGLKEEQREIYK